MTSKSCRTCPSFVPASQATTTYSQSIGGDTCRRFSLILSRPHLSAGENEAIATQVADGCQHHGSPAESNRVWIGKIGPGDPNAMTTAATQTPQNKPASCKGCEHYIEERVVRANLGWEAPMCAARGELLLVKLNISRAKGCGFGVTRTGAPRDTTDGVILDPSFMPAGFTPPAVKVIKPFNRTEYLAKLAIDPREYVTDKPVSEVELKAGVRAWREIPDPEGLHEPQWLPIFDGPTVCGFDNRLTYASMRPDLYVDFAGKLYDLVATLNGPIPFTPLMIGGAGTGKTQFACWLAWLMDVPFSRFVVNKETELRDFFGITKVVEQSGVPVTEFEMGYLPKAWAGHGELGVGIALIDEWNMNGQCAESLRPYIESDAKDMFIAEANVTIRKGDWFMPLLAQNPSSDPLYVGAEPLSVAELSRVSPHYFALPPEDVEREIIKKHCADGGYEIDALMLDKLMQVAADIRGQVRDGALPIAWGIRDQIKVASLTSVFSFEKAYRHAITDALDPGAAEMILAAARSVA